MRRQPVLGQRTIAVIGTILCFLMVLLLSGFSDCVDRGPQNCLEPAPEVGMYTVIYSVPGTANFAHATVTVGNSFDPMFNFSGKEDAMGNSEGCDKILSYNKLN
jgi:hypothetical protein